MSNFLKKILTNKLNDDEISSIYSSFDLIGDIAVIKIPETLEHKKNIIGKAILDNIKIVKTVFGQISPVQGEFRLRKLELLAGENKTITYYKEHGCIFKVDVAKTYFSPRLSTERQRISKQIDNNNDIILNMFSGVGTFSIIIAKKNRSSIVYNIDSNPDAIELAIINAKLNKVENRVFSIIGDARKTVVQEFVGKVNRVLMPLPELAKDFIDEAVESLIEKKGIIHYFAHVKSTNKRNAINDGITDTKSAFHNYNHKIRETRVVREVGPRIYQIVSDVLII